MSKTENFSVGYRPLREAVAKWGCYSSLGELSYFCRMSRILTGVQSTGRLHLGNLLGAILPAIALSKNAANESLYFIADLHSLTTVHDAALLRANTFAAAATWLACGLDAEKHLFYRQSDVPQVTELAWLLASLVPYPMLANAHSFKDKSGRRSEVSLGLFTYPILMAADILLYDAEVVPVGKDQVQHLEITRDIAAAFNQRYGDTFVLPTARVEQQLMTIPGIDGQKMSKSYGNILDVFAPENELYRTVNQIVTAGTPRAEPKEWRTDITFQLYALLASPEQVHAMRENYEAGGYGYEQAKHALYELLLHRFATEREQFAFYMRNPPVVEAILASGAQRAQDYGAEVLRKARQRVGL